MRRRLSVPVFVLHVLVGTAGAQLAVARQYLALLSDRHYADACQLLSPAQQARQSPDQFAAAWRSRGQIRSEAPYGRAQVGQRPRTRCVPASTWTVHPRVAGVSASSSTWSGSAPTGALATSGV